MLIILRTSVFQTSPLSHLQILPEQVPAPWVTVSPGY